MAETETKGRSVHAAAMWLCEQRDALQEPVIPALRRRFDLSIVEAIEATKAAHALAYPRVSNGDT